MNVVLFGPPGAGKSTYSKLLTKKLNSIAVSTGNLFRENLERNTVLGQKVKIYLDTGALVPDDLAIGLMTDKIHEAGTQCLLLDGFPRTLVQAFALQHMLKVDLVLNLVTRDEDIIDRLTSRGRTDDVVDVIRKRLEVYKLQSEPCLAFYRELGMVVDIDGTGTIDEVYTRILNSL